MRAFFLNKDLAVINGLGEYYLITRKITDYSGQLIVPYTVCAAPRACIIKTYDMLRIN